ncbi:hypothetical protein NDU88_004110 [Pleurodeles waltl]|uniref:Uncharacterized protein n=1 Tax=Pleurodeles waltl TaxID=8319 RepID=A0AAV7SHW5_PLEWA|nr:hypothetical protein NDU88_004110 [Pleurodeles waltl]
MACASSLCIGKKFKTKSMSGRRARGSPVIQGGQFSKAYEPSEGDFRYGHRLLGRTVFRPSARPAPAAKKSSFAVPVKARAPSDHRVEERVASGASHLTSKEWPVESLDSSHRRSIDMPMTSLGADFEFVTHIPIHDENLDYEYEQELEEGCVAGTQSEGSWMLIFGHSFICWVAKQADSWPFGRQLDFDGARVKVSWVGKNEVGPEPRQQHRALFPASQVWEEWKGHTISARADCGQKNTAAGSCSGSKEPP